MVQKQDIIKQKIMEGELKREGEYELFQTTRGHQIIQLGEEFYALVNGQKGDIIVKSDANHDKEKTLGQGNYFYADFQGDPDFQDTPHLFIQDGETYREMILPEGLPKEKDYQKKLVRTDEKLSREKVLEHVR